MKKQIHIVLLALFCILIGLGEQLFASGHDELIRKSKVSSIDVQRSVVDRFTSVLGFNGESSGMVLAPVRFDKKMSFCAWVKPDNLMRKNQAIMSIPEILSFRTTTLRELQFSQLGLVDNNTADLFLTNSSWFFVSVVIDIPRVSVYFNGKRVGDFAWKKTAGINSSTVYIGKSSWNENFLGQMYGIELYNEALSDREISDKFLSEYTKPELKTGVVVYFPFVSASDYFTQTKIKPQIENVSWKVDPQRKDVGDFDGFGSHINFGLVPIDNALTMAMWVRPADLNRNSGALISFGHAFALRIEGPKLLFTIPQIADLRDSTSVIRKDVWQHVAVTFKEGKGVTFYLNGKRNATFDRKYFQSAEKDLRIGTNYWNDYFKGRLSDFVVWNRILDDEEILQLSKMPTDQLQAILIPVDWRGYVFGGTLVLLVILGGFFFFRHGKRVRAAAAVHESVTSGEKIPSSFVLKVDQLVLDHLSDASYSVDQFAREMLMSKTKFYNELKQQTGFSIKEYLRDKRLLHAAHRLQTSDLSISEITFESGFESRAYFNKCFKERYGVTPTEYRQSKANLSG